MIRRMLVVLLAVALLAGAGLAAADEGRKNDGKARDAAHGGFHPELREHEGGKMLLHNDQIAVWFHEGKNHAKPDLRIAFNGTNDTKVGYRVQILRLFEVPENITEKLPGNLPRMNLAKNDDWNVQTAQTNESLTLTMMRAEAQGIVTLTFHIDTLHDTVKYDLQVDNWRWANASDRLVLDMLVMGHNIRNETGAKISVEDAGYISWAENATVKDANGTRSVPVEAYKKSIAEARAQGDDERGDENHEHEDEQERTEASSNSGGHILLLFNGTGGYSSLSYDPTFGVATQSAGASTVPFPAPMLAVAAIAGLALVLRRRA